MDIGGYFGLELADGGQKYHTDAMQFQSGRAALYFIIANTLPDHVYVPFYTCDALLQPIYALNIPFSFYSLDHNLEIKDSPALGENDLIIYVNYYDVKRSYVQMLSEKYLDRLIVDCSQAYFSKGNGLSWHFNSSRKFFGVADGCDLYVPEKTDLKIKYSALSPNTEYSISHLISRFNGNVQEGYNQFVVNEELISRSYNQISTLSKNLLSQVNFSNAQKQRMENFKYVHQQLGYNNTLLINEANTAAPSYYPFVPDRFIDKNFFWQKNIYIPVLWQDCIDRTSNNLFEFEKKLSRYLFPIPVDHRYTPDDLDNILNLINNY